MSNLVPTEAKKKIAIEYWMRVATVWTLLLIGTTVTAFFISLPTYVLVNDQVDAYRESAEEASQKIAVFESAAGVLVQASQQGKAVVDEAALEPLSKYILIFDSLQSPGLRITEVNISRASQGFEAMEINGTAANRWVLAEFRDRLLDQSEVETVDFPISNLAKDKDILFSMTVTIKKPTP
ncbi:MAG: hypothetical protein AAB388_00055 [Patescibacteria group bacterium]